MVAGLQVPEDERHLVPGALAKIGYPYWDETSNPGVPAVPRLGATARAACREIAAMEPHSPWKPAHVLATVLLLGSALGLAVWTWRARHAGDAAVYGRPAGASAGLSLAIDGDLPGEHAVHRLVAGPPGGLAAGQTWVLGSSLLYTVGALAWFWLLARVNRA